MSPSESPDSSAESHIIGIIARSPYAKRDKELFYALISFALTCIRTESFDGTLGKLFTEQYPEAAAYLTDLENPDA